jgi:hypothetical protein
LLFFSTALCFAGGQSHRETFDFGFGTHYTVEFPKPSGADVISTVTSIAINFAGVSYYTDNIGFGAYANLLFPMSLTAYADGEGITVYRNSYDFLFGMDLVLGPVFMLYKSEKSYFPLAAGLHYYQLGGTTVDYSVNAYEIGLGANLTLERHFNPRVYLYSRLQFAADFLQWGKVTEFTGYGYSIETPFFNAAVTLSGARCVGLGFQF